MIYIIGDTHGPVDCAKLLKLDENLTKDDYLIIAGDFGFVWGGDPLYEVFLQWLESKPYTILFIDGNHENFDMLYSYPEESFHGGRVHRIRKNICHLMRGEIFKIEQTSFFVMGGAISVDKARRVEHISWWKEEVPSQDEQEYAMKNLQKYVQEHKYVDFIITHEAPASILEQEFQYGKNEVSSFLDKILTLYPPLCGWFCGHHHIDKVVPHSFSHPEEHPFEEIDFTFLYDDFKRLV